MTASKLHWAEMYVGDTHIFAKNASSHSYALVWHKTGSTLYILVKGKQGIDLRLEQEIYELKFLAPSDIGPRKKTTAVVSLKMLPARHTLPWAKGYVFEPGYWTHRSGISFRITLNGDIDIAIYSEFTEWLMRNVVKGAGEGIEREEADKLWATASIWEVRDDDPSPDVEDLYETIVENGPGILKQRDMDCLEPTMWATDEIINYGLVSIRDRTWTGSVSPSFFIYSSFMYSQLVRHGIGKVSRWHSKADVFDWGIWVIPIHQGQHWFLVLVDDPRRALTDEEDMSDAPDDRSVEADYATKIYVLDSIADGHPNSVFKNIEVYLQAQAEWRLNKKIDHKKIAHYDVTVPEQPNGFDCGFYLLGFARAFVEQPDECRAYIQTGAHDLDIWGKPENYRADVKKMIEEDIAQKAGEQMED